MKSKPGSSSSLGRVLKSSREKVGLTQSDVARELGYKSPQFISNWERGLSSPPGNVLRKLADLYKLSAKRMYEILLAEETEALKLRLQRDLLGSSKSRKQRRA